MAKFMKLHFVVAGAGPAGLCAALSLAGAGHTVTVLEAKDQLTMLGAGLTVQPSATMALRRFGLGDWLEKRGVKNTTLVYYRYANGAVLGKDTTGNAENLYNAPSYGIHRGHFVQELYNLAMKRGNITIRFEAPVVDVNCVSDSSNPFVTLANGETVEGDVIIGADGVGSIIRRVVTGQDDRASDTGDSAYRAVLHTSVILQDPELASLVKETDISIWLGPSRRIIAYNISAMEEYNLVLVHESKLQTEESWTLRGDPDKMRALYADFEPRVVKLLALADSTYLWKLLDRPPISNWIHESGKIVVIGDACHPVLPYRAQGAGMAIEDADALGTIFSHITSKGEIKELLSAFESIRSQRCADAVIGARMSQTFFQVPDGPEQEARDAKLKNPGENDKYRFQSFYRYDTLVEVNSWWERRTFK